MWPFQRKRAEDRAAEERLIADLRTQRAALQEELDHIGPKLRKELRSGKGDKSSTLAKYPKRMVELRIAIDAIDEKIHKLEERSAKG
ncbi:MAG: hypothetical protein JXP34_12975 [Planctomycetes bacterium]|nr:hypothetical protein [Planctomycetota bacterium]